ncbi:MAG TPA: PAS domain-containing protein [Mariprofundaceae bacterium]|nr:PAS domain-containing protein [Mariprofundaceae bacterium]
MDAALTKKQYKALLESTQAIPWRLNWKTQQFEYIGPQIEQLLGWPQESWQTVEDWATRIHPDDRDAVVNLCITQSQSGIDHEADYRALTKDGGFIWMRDVVHVIRNGDEVEALVGFMFDISERKLLEQTLENANTELRKANEALQEAMRAIKAIGGIIPVCAWCGHKIKTNQGEWMNVDQYIRTHTESEVSHGICPDCKDGLLNP